MSNTKIFGANHGIATANVIPDNNSTALDIESTDAKDYITIDTSDGNEFLSLSGGGLSGQRLLVKAGVTQFAASGTMSILSEVPTSTNPVFCPNGTDTDTGIGSAGADRLSLIAGGTEALRLGGGGVIGKLETALTGTFTATNGSAEITSGSSTAFTTELHVGSAIELFESSTSRGVFTVTAIASDTALTLDSTVSGLSSSPKTGVTGKTDGGELFAVKNGDSKSILSVNASGVLGLSTTPDQGTDANGNNLGIGDPNMFDAVTSALRTTIIGNCRSNKAYSFTSGDSTTLIGFEAGRAFTGASRTVAIGAACANTATNTNDAVIVGMEAGQSAGNNTVYVGAFAGKSCTGQDNVGIGREALDATASAQATSVGYQSLTGLTATTTHNTALGYRAGLTLDSGDQCVFLGSTADTSDVDGDNQIAIGYGAVTDGPNKIRLGNSSIATCNIQVDWTVDSDERIKENVKDADAGLEFINALRPVSFTRKHPAEWPEEIREKRYKEGKTDKDDDGNEVTVSTSTFDVDTQQAIKDKFDSTSRVDGLIAQEVKAAVESLGVAFNGIDEAASGKMGIQYATLVVPLIKAVQELTARIEQLEGGD